MLNRLLKTVNSSCMFMKHTVQNTFQPITWLTSLVGVSAMEAFYHLAPRFGLSQIDNATSNGTFFLPPGKKAYVLGEFMFYLGAVGFVSLFRTLRPKIKGGPTFQAYKFGTMLYLFSSLIAMPLTGLTNPYMRQGVLKNPVYSV